MDDPKLVVINALMQALDHIVDRAASTTDEQAKVRDMAALAQEAIARYRVPVAEFNGLTKP
jgi:hypothetical protein